VSLSTTTYVRKPIYVDAVQVTEDNFDYIAGWCGGEVKETMSLRNRPVKYIHVPVTRPQTERQEQARVGDWILTSERGYKVYTPKAFTVAFDKVNEAPVQAYPYPDGDTLVLGPEVFAGGSGTPGTPGAEADTICWKGESFYTMDRAKELLHGSEVATPVPEAICNRCAAPKGLQAVGESCNNNCGGKVIVNPMAVHPQQETMATLTSEADREQMRVDHTFALTPEELVAERRVVESDIRNEAASGKIKAEEAEMQIARLPELPVTPVGAGPMPKQPLPDVDPATTPDANINPGSPTPKASEVWAKVENGSLTADQARQMLGVTVPTGSDIPEYLCNQCKREKPRSAVGEFCVECGGTVVSRDDVLSEQMPETTVGTKPMPSQPDPTDVEERDRPPAVPPNMQTAREIVNPKIHDISVVPATPENITAGTIPIPEQATENLEHPKGFTDVELKYRADLPAESIQHTGPAGIPATYTPTEGAAPVSTPEDPSTHVGVDLEKDEELKAGIDLTDENAIKAADDEAQLTADALVEEGD
jgi:hypothetical protein